MTWPIMFFGNTSTRDSFLETADNQNPGFYDVFMTNDQRLKLNIPTDLCDSPNSYIMLGNAYVNGLSAK